LLQHTVLYKFLWGLAAVFSVFLRQLPLQGVKLDAGKFNRNFHCAPSKRQRKSVCGTSTQRDAMRRQPKALNLVDCAGDVSVKRGRYNRNTPDDPPVLDRLSVREVPAPHAL